MTVDSLILDSVQPVDPALGSLALLPSTFKAALDQLISRCEVDAACDTRYPDLENRLRAVIAQADLDPHRVVAVNQVDGESFEVVVDSSRLANLVFQALYFPEGFGAIPAMVAELEAGETRTLASLAGLQVTNLPSLSSGMFAAVMCHDYLSAHTPQVLFEEGLTGDPLFDQVFPGLEPPCDVFASGTSDASAVQPVVSEVPALFMSGLLDPITPPEFAATVASDFSNAQVVVHPNGGHAVSVGGCLAGLVVEFVSSPEDAVDSSCLESLSAPTFVPASLERTAFVGFSDEASGLVGSVPAQWDQPEAGVVSRSDVNLAHQTVILQRAFASSVDDNVERLSGQFAAEFEPAGELVVSGRNWRIFAADAPISPVRLWAHESDGVTLAVLLLASETDVPEIEDEVIAQMLEDLRLAR